MSFARSGQRRRARLRAGMVTLLLVLPPLTTGAAIRTLPKGKVHGSEAVRRALSSPTEAGQVEGLILLLTGDDLPTALEAMESLAEIGRVAVPRLVSEMRRARNNWLIGGALVRMGTEAVGPLIELLEGANEATAVDCIYLLGEIQDRRAIPTLARFLEDSRDKVRMYAVTSLLQIGGAPAVEAVLSRLTREGKGVEGFIIEALIRYGKKSVEPVILSLTSEDPRVRTEAAYLLGGLGDLRAVDPLILSLDDADSRVRENAAFALGELSGLTLEADHIVRALVPMLADESEKVVEAARDALSRYGERAVPQLIERCQTAGEAELVACLNALREIGSPQAEDVMLGLLKHRSRRVRVVAAAGLIESGTGRAVEPLLDALRDEDLRWFASLALEKVGGENPDLFFAARPNDPTMSLRTQILVRLGSAVVPFLLENLRGDNLGRRAASLWILGEIADPSSARVVVGLLDDEHLGWLAGRALKRMGDEGMQSLVEYLSGRPTDTGARQAVETLALFNAPQAWDALEAAIAGPLPRGARVRAAVLLSSYGDPERVDRLRRYLDYQGRALWPDVEAALRDEGRVR